MSKSFKDEPVLIILVNSGNSRHEVKKYMQRVDVDLPTIVDKERTFERQFDVGKITLENVIQIKVFRPGKGSVRIPSRNMKKHLKRVKGNPSWSVSSSNVPDRLRPLWRAVEFGNYQRAGKLFQQVGSGEGNEKKMVERLRQQVYQNANNQLGRARSLGQNGKYWESFKLYKNVIMNFRTFPDFEPPRSALESLQNKSEVKKQLKAKQIFQKLVEKGMLRREGINNPQIKEAYNLLTQKFSETEAAKQAKYLNQ